MQKKNFIINSLFNAIFKCCLLLIETGCIPDFIIRLGIRFLLMLRIHTIFKTPTDKFMQDKLDLFNQFKNRNIAEYTKSANEQHYELPTTFFELSLGLRMKYSSCYYAYDDDNIEMAENNMLELYCKRAKLNDGQKILDLGCGWGSLSLYLAAKYPNSEIVSMSNSKTQKDLIKLKAEIKNLKNVKVITADINDFDTEETFDRILSIEMFEHLKNYEILLAKIEKWLKSDGLLFVHHFCHKSTAYEFKIEDEMDWMAKNFFSGGTMPSYDMLLYFQKNLIVDDIRYINGTHYSRTLEDWLRKMDKNKDAIKLILKDVYKEKVKKWYIYWRLFYLACSELFKYNEGNEWGITHVLFKKRK